MPATLEEWSDQYWEQTFTRHTSQVDTTKLLVTFAAGFSGSLVGTALQVEPQGALDRWAVGLLALSFLLAVLTVILDRLTLPDRAAILVKRHNNGWTPPQTLQYVADMHSDLETENKLVVRRVREAARWQLLASLASACLAVMSLLG